MPSRYRLTPEVESAILSYIRSGGYPWVAAEGAGIPRQVFAQWLRRGAKPRSRALYRSFYIRVIQARAQGRLAAEIETRKKDPRYWLTHGPGRETSGAPGWTNPPKPRALEKKKDEKVWASERFLQLMGPVLAALTAFPEARAAIAQELERLGQEKGLKRRGIRQKSRQGSRKARD
jgi:hypothetical protein